MAKRSGVGAGVLSVVEILIVIVVAFFVLRFLAAMGGAGSSAANGGVGAGGAGDSIGSALKNLFGAGNGSPGFGEGSGSSFNLPNPFSALGKLFGNSNSSAPAWENLAGLVNMTGQDWLSLDDTLDTNDSLIDIPFDWNFQGLIPQYSQQGVDLSDFQFDPSYSNSSSEGLPTDTPDNTDNYISVDDSGDGGDGE